MPRKSPGSSHDNHSKRVTLQDIADVAGVTKMAVSNALNGAPNVSPAMREKIKEIAKDLNYIPNFAARALNSGETGIIAIMSGAANEPYYGSFIHFLEAQINADGYNVLLMRRRTVVREMVKSSGPVAVDGAIAVDMPLLVGEFEFHPSIPCIAIGTIERSYVDNVLVDLTKAVNQALEIMIASGRKRIAYLVTAPHMAEETEVRAKAYLEAIRKTGREPEIIDLNTNELTVVDERFRAYIAEFGCPDALLCQNDDTALTAFRVIRDAGLRVPEDVLLVGCDGQWHTRNVDPPLSTIVQPIEEMCSIAWRFLKQRLADPSRAHQRAVTEGTLLVRESLGVIEN
jgi:DNA-binding LacI/PurR family transcriptional regulator